MNARYVVCVGKYEICTQISFYTNKYKTAKFVN